MTNLQGDVVGILDSTGTAVVNYTYDAWGRPLSTTGTMKYTLGQLNPLRYRGYVYDEETWRYYLQSRYYDPYMGRFLNADVFATTGQGLLGNNMFAYCGNNPVLFRDTTGTRHEISAGGIGVRDVTKEIMVALNNENIRISELTLKIKSETTKLGLDGAGEVGALIGGVLGDFYLTVTHKAPWDIKLPDSWEDTIGTEFPGRCCEVCFDGMFMTPEMLGNFTYGYLGRNYGLILPILYIGSYAAAGVLLTGDKLNNELWDWEWIKKGYNYAYANERS